MLKFGLIGKNIDYSFSRAYFNKKFESETLSYTYENFDIDDIEAFPGILKEQEFIRGLNVTIPYKETIIPYLDKLNKKARKIGAVNTIKVTKKGKLIGYNTDYYGFKKSLEPLLHPHHTKALILGTGGASKAIKFALKLLAIQYSTVSRKKGDGTFTYDMLNADILENHPIIINCTPLGTFPDIENCPPIPYGAITSKHLLYDLIYNPAETTFLKQGKLNGATVCNGLKMLELQAEKAWKIWQ